jgi:hypothetical protein
MFQQISFREKEIFRKEKTIHEIFEITPSRYIDPAKALEEILTQMTAVYEGNLRWDYLSKSFVYSNSPIYYEILYSEGKITFNYILPNKYSKIITGKIDKIFRVAGIQQKDDYFPKMFANSHYCSFHQNRHFMFSLSTDIKETGLLDGLMSIISNLQLNDNLLLQIGIVPLEDHWKSEWFKANQRFKNGEELKVEGNIFLDAIDKTFKLGDNLFDLVDTLIGVDTKKKNNRMDRMDMQSRRFEMLGNSNYRNAHFTSLKVNWNGYLTSIKVFCDNSSPSRIRYYSRLFNGIFRILDGDQELRMGSIKRFKGKERIFETQMFNRNIFSSKELSQFLRLPDRRLQYDFKSSMKSIEVTENEIPKELLDKNSIPIGETTYKGNKIMTYWNTKDKDMSPMHKIITGLQRSGKSNYLQHFAINAMKAGHSVFVIDSIKMCELADGIRDHLPMEFHDKIIVLDYSNLDFLLSLAWSELRKYQSNTDTKHRMLLASQIAGNLESFIESVGGANTPQEKFSARMKRFLACSAKLVLSQDGTNIKDVLDVLQYRDIRDEFIIKSNLPEDNVIVQELRRLDDPKTGTKYDLISGIIDRASIMTNDYLLELLLNQKPNDDIDFRYWADNGYAVLIKVSELKISRTSLRPLVSFIYSKIWLSMFSRGEQKNPRLTHVILDEIHNFPEICNMIKGNCREAAKYALSYVFTSHMLTDLKGLLSVIKGSGANFMLFKTSKENLKLLEEELMQGNIEIQEAMELKKFHSINIVNYDREYSVFTTKSPDLIDKSFKKYDRSYLDLECSKKYGTPFED